MDTHDTQNQFDLNKRLETAALGLFFIMLGGLWLVPQARVPGGAWLVGAGLILLGLNLARFLLKVPVSRSTIILGGLLLLLGISDFLGLHLPLFPILLIAAGLSMLLKPLLDRPASQG
jgi:hypothetical protein